MTSKHNELHLDGTTFEELFEVEGLERLDRRFLNDVKSQDPDLHSRLLGYRKGAPLEALDTSELLLALAPLLEDFIAQLFQVDEERGALARSTVSHNAISDFRREFVAKRGRRYRKPITQGFATLDAALDGELSAAGLDLTDREQAIATYGMRLLQDPSDNREAITRLTQWCYRALNDPDGQSAVRGWVSFKLPQRIDYARLVPLQSVPNDPAGRLEAAPDSLRQRDGFGLTDPRMPARHVQGEVNYCIYCHEHDGDFCSKGFPEKKGAPELGLKVNPLGETLTGCPLDEKISEMHRLKLQGQSIAALAMAMVDNPMVSATGHRICNDCMKGCIYQKQDPVNIPQIETRVLTDVLNLPWGVEVHDLLTRWNPLRQRQYRPKPYNGRKVLIAGMGPAGFTMAHHLTMEGCAVVGIDGLKIEPLPQRLLNSPTRQYTEISESLDERILAGFGGVAEYGITARWDKNFLKLIYLGLARRHRFQVFGGVRLGGTITMEDAWQLGFDHVCIATGAGLPRVISVGNSLARGMRQANDFLMALQLTGAAKASSLANLQVRLPAVVIGGGLTAIDTATEVQAYYIRQVEKTLDRYERLVQTHGNDHARQHLDTEHQGILDEFLTHGELVREERVRAAAAGEKPDFIGLLHAWGGVTIAYRRSINESPAYLRNHEEIIEATREGIYFAEALDPLRAKLDQYGHVEGMVFRRRHRSQDGRWLETWTEATLPARAVFVAAGASPNTIYESEHRGTFQLEGNHFLPHICHHDRLQPVRVSDHCKAPEFGPFTSYNRGGHQVTFLGDTHPVFHGSVVKAIASSARSYPYVMRALEDRPPAQEDAITYAAFRAQMTDLLTPRVAEIKREHPSVLEVWVRAPMAARNFKPGQFFRLQSYESLSPLREGTRLQIPLLTVSGTGIREDKIRLMILAYGAGPELASQLKPGDPIVLMGPTGAPAEIPKGKTVLIVAGQWGGAVMLDLGPALRAAGNRVLYFAAYNDRDELFCQPELEDSADQIVWCTANGPLIEMHRPQDLSVAGGNLVDLIGDFGRGRHTVAGNRPSVRLSDVDLILVMGSTGLLSGMKAALSGELGTLFGPGIEVLGTVGSPMQCMLKGVCAQCLQWQIDPETGDRTRAVFACAMQDQPLFWIDLDNLAARQSQNRLAEHLSNLWLKHLLSPPGVKN